MLRISVPSGLKFPDDFLGCKICVRLGCVVIWRHDTKHRIAPEGHLGGALSGNGRAPAPRLALVGNDRIFGAVGHGRGPRARYHAMSTSEFRGRHHAAIVTAPLGPLENGVLARFNTKRPRPGGVSGVSLGTELESNFGAVRHACNLATRRRSAWSKLLIGAH
jgi:hypothetical protein